MTLFLAAVLCLALLGRWVMQPPNAGNEPAHIDRGAAVQRPQSSTPPLAEPSPAADQTGALETSIETAQPMRRGYTLRGRVYDEASGKGIAGARIEMRESHVRRFEGNFRVRPNTTSNTDGMFALEGVPEGRVIVSVSAQQHAAREVDVMVVEKTPPLAIALSSGGAIAGYLAAADGLTPLAGNVGLFDLDQGFV